jgi:MOSC domain-containing protein YiiM
MLSGRVASLQTGTPAPMPWRGRTTRSAIFKRPVDGPLRLGAGGFEGDEQADLTVHGGPDKAACAYPVEHVPRWERLLGSELPRGAFGENLSVEGLLENDVHVGDVFTVGTATVQVSQPRGPCFKLAARWQRRDLPARMASERISGWYFRVLEEGVVRAGDELRLIDRLSDVSIGEVMRVTYAERDDGEGLARVLAVPELAAQWRDVLVTLARRAELPVRDFGTGV